MKTQLATLLLVFAHHGDAAHNIRGVENHSLQRKLRSGKRSGRDEDYGAYRVVGGKKGFNDNYGAISFEEDPPVLWLVVKKGDEKTGRCISSLSEWALENYNVDLAVVEKDPRNRVASEDILVFLEKKTSANECEEIANDIAEADGLSDRKRGGVFDNVENIAFFDVKTEDKDCDKKCKRDKDKCEDDAGDDEDELRECKKDEDRCKKDCEEECEDDCDDFWPGIFNSQCRRAC